MAPSCGVRYLELNAVNDSFASAVPSLSQRDIKGEALG